MRGVLRHRHRFLPAGDNDVGIAIGDLLHADGDGAEPRAAKLVQTPGGRLLQNTSLHRGLAGRVLALPGGEDLAHDDLIDIGRIDAGALERCLDRRRAELMGRCAGKHAIERAHRRAGRAHDHDVIGHFSSSLAPT